MKKVLSVLLLMSLLLGGCNRQNSHLPDEVLAFAQKTAEGLDDSTLGDGYSLHYIDDDNVATATGDSVEELIDSDKPSEWLFIAKKDGQPDSTFTLHGDGNDFTRSYGSVTAAYVTALERAKQLAGRGVPTLLRYHQNDYFVTGENGYVLAAFTPSTEEEEKAAGRVAYYESLADFVAALKAASAVNAVLLDGTRGGEVAYPSGHYLPE